MLLCVGLSHHTAPAEVRERHAFPNGKVAEALIALRDYDQLQEAAILSTCNRLEIYAVVADFDRGRLQIKQFLNTFRNADPRYDVEPHLYILHEREAARHLLRVAAGLDSLLIGDTEILGQLRDAYRIAQNARSCRTILHRLFREAFSTGKAARSTTAIGRASTSIATAAVCMSAERVGSLRERSVLLLGTGKMGVKAARRLREEGASLLVLSRTYERAADLVARVGSGTALSYSQLFEALCLADVVITSTASSEYVLSPEIVARAMRARTSRRLCIVDIAIPRNVDPGAARIPGVQLIGIDELDSTTGVRLDPRDPLIPSVELIVDAHTDVFDRWYNARKVAPLISRLSSRVESIRESEIERLLSRCPGLTERERTLIIGMSMRVVSRLVHPVFTGIRESAGALPLAADLVERFFGVVPEPAESEEEASDYEQFSALQRLA